MKTIKSQPEIRRLLEEADAEIKATLRGHVQTGAIDRLAQAQENLDRAIDAIRQVRNDEMAGAR